MMLNDVILCKSTRFAKPFALIFSLVGVLQIGFGGKAYCARTIIFDAPGANLNENYQGTYPVSINREGAIAGIYNDATESRIRAFVRSPNGKFTIFDVPDAWATGASSISADGVITGDYVTEDQRGSAVQEGYVRSTDGTISTFSGTYGLVPTSINSAGISTGYNNFLPYVAQGYVRNIDGTITTFDAPKAGTRGEYQGTFPSSINPAGAITGTVFDSSDGAHGFLRTPSPRKCQVSAECGSTIITFDVAGAAEGEAQGTRAVSINPAGSIAGYYSDPSYMVHGFVRSPKGKIVTFDPPEATGTIVTSINAAAAILGSYIDGNERRGFIRHPNGTFKTFSVKGSTTKNGFGIMPTCINAAGVTTGYYQDANGVSHGFLRIP